MADFICNGILWTLALYGLFEIIKSIIYICTYPTIKENGIYLIIAVKNQEEKIEGFLRTFLFRHIYEREDRIKNIIIADLDSNDSTVAILKKLQKEQEYINVCNWKECKEIFDNINSN